MTLSKLLTASFLISILTSSAFAHDNSQARENKKIVTEFYKLCFIDHNPKEAADKYFGEKYIQHNPKVPDGKDAFVNFFTPFFKSHPDHHVTISHLLADGDLVALHVHGQSDKKDFGHAVVDIFRVENKKIVEHWDVVQDVPEKSANNNTMF